MNEALLIINTIILLVILGIVAMMYKKIFLKKREGISFDEEDELYEKAKEIVIRKQKASASLLQRELRIGYARSARLVDLLEEEGVIGPADGAEPREVLAIPKVRL